MARMSREHPPVHCTDRLPVDLTPVRPETVADALTHGRDCVVRRRREQWQLCFETCWFDKQYDVDKLTLARAMEAANRAPCCAIRRFDGGRA